MQYAIDGKGCVYYPSDAQPPFAAVAISDGFGGSGGCDSVQTNEWGPFYASHGIVAMIIETGTGDPPNARGQALLDSLAALKAENDRAGSPLHENLAGRYGTSGFSNGGGGTTYAAASDKSLLTSIAVMPWGFADGGSVPTLIFCGTNDSIAPCEAHGTPGYAKLDASTPKMRVTVMSEYDGQPSAGMGSSGAYALAFQKVFLEGDQRWRALLVAAKSEATTIH
jgi:dienelactone hydrolase